MIPESHLEIQQHPSEGLEVLWGEERGGVSGQGVFLAATHDVSESFKGAEVSFSTGNSRKHEKTFRSLGVRARY